MIGFAQIPSIAVLPMWLMRTTWSAGRTSFSFASSSMYHSFQYALGSDRIIGNNCHNSPRLISENFCPIFLDSPLFLPIFSIPLLLISVSISHLYIIIAKNCPFLLTERQSYHTGAGDIPFQYAIVSSAA